MNSSFHVASGAAWLLLTVLFFCLPAFSQNPSTGSIAGIVVDSATREPIVGANVFLPGTTVGAATDADGRFLIRSLVYPGRTPS